MPDRTSAEDVKNQKPSPPATTRESGEDVDRLMIITRRVATHAVILGLTMVGDPERARLILDHLRQPGEMEAIYAAHAKERERRRARRRHRRARLSEEEQRAEDEEDCRWLEPLCEEIGAKLDAYEREVEEAGPNAEGSGS